MSSTNEQIWTLNGGMPSGRRKPGPKGKVMEPYADEILLLARSGQSMQCISNWLAEAPRNVHVTRQAVHCWLRARIRKLVKLDATFANTGVALTLQVTSGVPNSRKMEQVNVRDPPSQAVRSQLSASRALAKPSINKADISEFLMKDFELSRSQDPVNFNDQKQPLG